MIPKEHQLKCTNCGQMLDMRDLSQVFAHENCNGIPVNNDEIKQIPYKGSRKIGSSTLWTKDKKRIELN